MTLEEKIDIVLRNQVAINARLQELFKLHNYPDNLSKSMFRSDDHDRLEDSANELFNGRRIIEKTSYIEDLALDKQE
jgi:hypothetical protein